MSIDSILHHLVVFARTALIAVRAQFVGHLSHQHISAFSLPSWQTSQSLDGIEHLGRLTVLTIRIHKRLGELALVTLIIKRAQPIRDHTQLRPYTLTVFARALFQRFLHCLKIILFSYHFANLPRLLFLCTCDMSELRTSVMLVAQTRTDVPRGAARDQLLDWISLAVPNPNFL
jgi:hypothetical protein